MTGELRKMRTQLQPDNTILYSLPLFSSQSQTSQELLMNDLIGKPIHITYHQTIHCTNCGAKTKKTFLGGLCYKCFMNAPQGSPCIIRPELCRGHEGQGRDPKWEEENHNQPHVVYLASTNVIKVGVTRKTQLPTRWIDQGANEAIQLAETPNRYLAGIIEVALKDHFTDKTNWRRMLKNETDPSLDLESSKWEMEELLPDDLSQYMVDDDTIATFSYPVLEYPEKVKSLQLEKTPEINGILKGIKGQYLLLDNDRVINIRSFSGYTVSIE